ncbi:(2Fe-2S)-binding protein [Pseudactinotalea suaedae]|uniref:(2Fe-2S)-binding protein n=1 Tax=Pseudactinotalea suaedae TaxID=1524924 RepID=UPI0012E1E5BA|nr:(2Fe-2S)-binding protein [Pseudactinotalea suaedae]
MRLNGIEIDNVPAELHGMRLLDYLRTERGLTGAKEGCGMGECGSCTVVIDGAAVTSCLVLVGQVLDAEIRTVEGLADAGHGPLQRAFVARQAVQCGYCIPGVLNSCAALLDRVPDPDDEQIRTALDGNLCRCTAYNRFYDAVHDAACERRTDQAGQA